MIDPPVPVVREGVPIAPSNANAVGSGAGRSLWDVSEIEAQEAEGRLKRLAFRTGRARVTVRREDLMVSLHEKGIAEMGAEVVGFVREAAKRVTGGNFTFVDDDLALLEHLAIEAVKAGLLDGLHPSVATKALAAQSSEAPTPADGPKGSYPGQNPNEPIPPNPIQSGGEE